MSKRSSVLLALFLSGCGGAFAPARDPHVFFRAQTRTSCEDDSVVRFVNEPSIDAIYLKEVGVNGPGADELVQRRNGPDGVAGTADDLRFPSVAAIDAVPWVGESSIEALYRFAARTCDFVVDPEAVCMETAVTDWLSSADTSVGDITAIGVADRSAMEIVRVRDGLDGLAATSDDQRFLSLGDVEAVPQVGPQTMANLLAWGLSRCQMKAEAVFSPVDWQDSHLARVVHHLDHASRSADLAIYSLRDAYVIAAIERAVGRGVRVRVISDGASQDRVDPEGTTSARLEAVGVEVRWVNKVMHHKFALIDGPVEHASQAGDGVLITGSGNWTSSAASRYDENTLVFTGDSRLNLQFQREFNLMWENGRPVVWNETIPSLGHTELTTDDVFAAEGATAWFTSSNFEAYQHSTYGPTFRTEDSSSVRDQLVQLIQQADRSIWIASGHLRSRPIMDALIDKKRQDPSIDIRVYLDNQEFIGPEFEAEQDLEHQACLAAAVTDAARADCMDDGYYLGATLFRAGVQVRYKTYAYRWDANYADQMHHKYMLIDSQILATGSYNLSPNAEFDTFENVVVLHSGQYRQAVSDFGRNFAAIWETNRQDELAAYWALLDQVFTPGSDFPIVFPPMALAHDEVQFLEESMRTECPVIDSDAWRENPATHRVCNR